MMKRWLLACILLGALSGGCDDPEPAEVPPPPAPASPSLDEQLQPTAAGLAIAAIDAQIGAARERATQQGGWIHHEALAQLYLSRARLSGDIQDYVLTEQVIGEAFRQAPQGSGPLLTRASFNMTVHRPKLIEADLSAFENRPVKQDHELATIAGLRGDAAFQGGDLDEALKHYLRAEEELPSVVTAGLLANVHRARGAYDAAATWYDRAIQRVERRDPGLLAWALVHRGVVEFERGRVDEALRFYEKADEAFDGWFMIEAHIAGAKLARGDVDEAVALYKSIVARVPAGAHMAALADALERRGDQKQAVLWRVRATEAFERDIARMESAVAAHALDFFLATNPARALELARRNFELRPGPESRTKLAQALVVTGNREEARAVLAGSKSLDP